MFEINYIAKILSDLRIPELIANASKTGIYSLLHLAMLFQSFFLEKYV